MNIWITCVAMVSPMPYFLTRKVFEFWRYKQGSDSITARTLSDVSWNRMESRHLVWNGVKWFTLAGYRGVWQRHRLGKWHSWWMKMSKVNAPLGSQLLKCVWSQIDLRVFSVGDWMCQAHTPLFRSTFYLFYVLVTQAHGSLARMPTPLSECLDSFLNLKVDSPGSTRTFWLKSSYYRNYSMEKYVFPSDTSHRVPISTIL